MNWNPGDRLTHHFNRELGPGRVLRVEGRTVVVSFPRADTELRLAADSDALDPLELPAGSHARLYDTGETVTIAAHLPDGMIRLEDGREVPQDDLWPLEIGESLLEHLAHGHVDPVEAFSNRLDTLHLLARREADGLGSFLGGRIRLFPHQLYAAERATRADPIRWLLADEVGLGKTVEACLILNHLLAARRAENTVVVAPDTLTVQWLGELWRKYHQVFVLLDDKRLADVEKEYGAGFNPFDAHRRVVVGLEMLVAEPWLVERAVESGIDLLIVDEAHQLRRPPGHPGNPEYRAVQPLAETATHALLLTATPLEDDAHGFFRLLQLLRPDEFPDAMPFEERLARREPLPPFTSMTRRDDIGGLPPRRPAPVEPADPDAWKALSNLETAVRAIDAPHEVARRAKAEKLRRALASGPSFEGLLGPKDGELKKMAKRAGESDPRVAWLADNARIWRDDGDKTLVFVARRETLEMIRTRMSRLAQVRVGVFHEDLSPAQRDIEVAQFRLASGPSMLVSTECGGEGRNFEFCTRMVLFDLPWDPMVVEQRIGRLDRIGRELPVEIVYFRPPSGVGAAVVELFETLGLFRKPLGGLGRELAGVEQAIVEAALEPGEIDAASFKSIVAETGAAYTRVQEAAHHELHREAYRAEMADGVLARVPDDLEELTEEVVLQACEQLNLDVEPGGGVSRYSISIGNRARVDSLPGVAGGSSFLGTFNRQEAVEDETIDFYATGHPLVEGILAHIEDDRHGRVALLGAGGKGEQGFGLLALYHDGPQFEAVAVDIHGKERPDWAEAFTRRPLKTKRIRAEQLVRRAGWPSLIRNLATHLEGKKGTLVAVAALAIEE